MSIRRVALFLLALTLTVGCTAKNGGFYNHDRGYYDDRYYDDYDRRAYERHRRHEAHKRYKEDQRELRKEQRELDRERREFEREQARLERERKKREREAAKAKKVYRCPAGFSPSNKKCSKKERKRGCKDMRLPNGQGCVKR